MPKKIDLTGQRFGRLTVIKDTGKREDSSVWWLCKCDCGNEKEIRSAFLRKGLTRSCGCLRIENGKQLHKHLKQVSFINEKNRINNTSGVKGVYWNRKAKKWQAQIRFEKKFIYLGTYKNLEDAAQARKEAEEKYFKPILEKYGKED